MRKTYSTYGREKTKTRGLRYRRNFKVKKKYDPSSKAEADALALRHLPTLLTRWLPEGRFQGNQYIALNPTRDDRHLGSFQINTRTGVWADFATEDKGKGAVSIVAYLFDVPTKMAIEIVMTTLGEIL